MAEFPALPLFTDSLIADTAHLNDEEFGRYIRLLIIMWRSPDCRIPNDRSWVAKRLRLDPLQYDSDIKPLVDEFCISNGNWLMQKRLTKVFETVREKVQKNTEAAKSRWQKEKSTSERISERNANQNQNQIYTPLPPKGGDRAFKHGLKGKGEKADIDHYLDDSDRLKARQAAPGYDLQYLIRTYNADVEGRDWPKYPAKAFVGWCGALYKKRGKP